MSDARRSASPARVAQIAGRAVRGERAPHPATAEEWAIRPTDGESEAEFQLALWILGSRGRRRAILGRELFSDPAWDILLDLYVHQRSGLSVPVTGLCTGFDIPQTTLLRWVRTLVQKGLIARRADACDGRRVFVMLTALGRRRMDRFLRETLASLPFDEICR